MQIKNTTANNIIPKAKKENIWINLAFNIVIPAFILSKLSSNDYLGPTLGLIVALAFPLFYGLMDFQSRHKVNIFSILGVASTLLTGTISLLELDPQYIAIKEAFIPSVIFVAVLVSSQTSYPLVEKLILNEAIFDLEKLNIELDNHHAQERLAKVMKTSSYMIASSFLFSAVLNYILAKTLVVSLPGTEAYNAELGKLAIYSYPVIALPCTVIMMCALYYLMHNLQKITGMEIEDFLLLGKPE